MDEVIKVGAAGGCSAAIRADDSLWAWGGNSRNFLEFENPDIPNKVADNVYSVYTGPTSLIFKKNDGTLWGCGRNNLGQLGDGTFENRSEPVLIMEGVRLPG